MKLILPKTLPLLTPYADLPLFFLMGPIQGGGDWQLRMARLLEEAVGECVIVNPSRYKPTHPLYQFRLSGDENAFPRHTDWEHHFLRVAASTSSSGCIVCWTPSESKTEPRDDGEAYARESRGEIAEWRTHLVYRPDFRFVMGAEREFPGLSQIRRNFELSLPDFRIYDTMADVVREARRFAKK